MALRIGSTVRNILAIWGALSLVLLFALAVVIAYQFRTAVSSREGRATKADVRFVLNWPGLGDERIEAVVHSYESQAYLMGDHYIAYAIRVTHLSESELMSNARWRRGNEVDALMTEAIRFVSEAHDRAPWLPTADELLTDKYFVWRWRVEVGDGVSAASLIFARPSDRMVFYISLQV